uniref:Uncharacterized protein n=1 Tax=Tanacetum cinerariifolium TaxID=118510 RepID=A0A699JIZ6_TANCI|nr:hypothetical protein [Tanacetum cinerariifolium]
MAKHKEIYIISSHTKKVFANMRRQGHGFSGNVTPLFETMMVNAQEEVGEGLGLHIDSHHTPIDTQPSSSKPQKKIKPKRKQRQETKVHSLNSEIPVEESILTPSNDPLPSEEAKTAQAKEIANLNKRVKKLEKTRKSRPGRSIEDIDPDAKITLVDEAHGRMQDADMFGVNDLEGNEVIVDNFNREDLEVLRSIVNERFKKTKPVDDMDNLLIQTLKTMFEPHVEDIIWKYQQGAVKVNN